MDTDDPAKARAEARAERELQLKIETLELEREKFRYTKRQSHRDRLSAAGARGAGALMFAHGSMIVVSLTNFKSLADLITLGALRRELVLIGIGLFLAAAGLAFTLGIGAVAYEKSHRGVNVVWALGALCLTGSFVLFYTILEGAIRALAGL